MQGELKYASSVTVGRTRLLKNTFEVQETTHYVQQLLYNTLAMVQNLHPRNCPILTGTDTQAGNACNEARTARLTLLDAGL
jgi:hypothetical protein